MLYRGMDRAQLDAAYNNSVAVPERDVIVADWAARSAKVRRENAGRVDLADGDTPRERLDLFLAADPQTPTFAFIHGGVDLPIRPGFSAGGRIAARLAGPRVGAFWKPGDPALISFSGPAWR